MPNETLETNAQASFSSAPSRRGGIRIALVVLALVLLVLLVLGPLFPGPVGTFAAILRPWLWLPSALVALGALFARRWRSSVALAIPLGLWSVLVLPGVIPPLQHPGGVSKGLTVASLNVHAGSDADTVSAQAGALEHQGADVIALVELDQNSRSVAARTLADSYPYSSTVGTVGLWSRFPLHAEQPLELGLGWKRALQVTVDSPAGSVSLYALHAASVRAGDQEARDLMLSDLADAIRQDSSPRILAIGDFNAVADDPAMAGVRELLEEPRQSVPSFGMTWPSAFPLARIDHVYQRGLTPVSNIVQDIPGSDHRAVVASFEAA
ncbi:endonuclease/exonuclease/phosphatase family protein [Arthrobacter sp. NPDC090010]|uniref:endonuclease/exonuclease/phosphatase family protein n=1 Tax=Arthrobacter sp. NPDC090010 TaxID=3363942 RepID=UPI00381FFDC2